MVTGSRRRALLSWSSGKDSAWALHELCKSGDFEVAGLLTTVDERSRLVAAHGVARSLVEAQAKAVGLPLRTVEIPWPAPNDVYERAMKRAFDAALRDGIEAVAFGDLFLEDIRAYRERQLDGTGLMPLFPLWGRDTGELAREMLEGGLRARVVAVDLRRAPREIAGRLFDEELLRGLPASCDPCGENGEFHTFAFDGPMFRVPVPVTSGALVERDGFLCTELIGTAS